jgi:hypothetical protein
VSLIRYALTAQQWPHHRAFRSAAERPAEAQARVLRGLLRANAASAFGREHGFARVTTPADYARAVPARDYEALRPWMARVAAGEANVLTAQAPFAFAATSGTTGEAKLIPVTPGSARASAALMRLWTFHALAGHPGLLDGRVLTMVGPAVEGVTSGGAPYGAMTGLTYQRLPWLIRRRHALPYEVALIRDHETRYFVAARLALARSVSSIGTPNPSTLLRLAEVATRRAEDLVRAIHDGTLGVDDVEPIARAGVSAAELRTALTAGLGPDGRRAAALSTVQRQRGRLVLGACWPELALVACWLGGSAGIQARHLAAHFPGVPQRDLGLVASEGRLTIPLEDGSPAGVLAVHAGYYEFIPEEDIDAPAPRTLGCHELQDGRCYYVLLTGGHGLYRYDLNDVVEVRGFWGRTPRLAFVRKGRDMLNITGEKLHLNHVLHAVRAAERATGLPVWQFRLIPDVEAARYDLLLESPRAIACPPALADFAAAVDAALATVNCEYRAKRASARLGPPRLYVMRPGWSERRSAREFAAGGRETQHKWSVLRPEWDEASRTEVLHQIDVARPEGRTR